MRLGVLAGPRRLAYIAAYRNKASPPSSDSATRASSMQCSRLRALDAIAPLFFRLLEFVCVHTVAVIIIVVPVLLLRDFYEKGIYLNEEF